MREARDPRSVRDPPRRAARAAARRRRRRRRRAAPASQLHCTATMMFRAVSVALIVGSSAAAAASDENTATCNPSTWSAGHDFKNMQYSHINGTSAADWYAQPQRPGGKSRGSAWALSRPSVRPWWVALTPVCRVPQLREVREVLRQVYRSVQVLHIRREGHVLDEIQLQGIPRRMQDLHLRCSR
jgi:hypothetical protein